jgi:maltose/moltooligosaccharide transporter
MPGRGALLTTKPASSRNYPPQQEPLDLMTMLKKKSYWQLLLMSMAFFGIQHGFSIQFSKMSVIYEKLGAQTEQIPFLWLAAPLTGFFVQPLVGYLSDRTWLGVLGRRRPYFLAGSVLAAIALVFLPNVSTVWMAAGLLWVLDASLNISMEPCRAFMADSLPSEQLSDGYSMQTLMVGLGGALGFFIASIDWLHILPQLKAIVPSSLHIQFYLCALIYFIAVTITVVTTSETPPPKQTEEEKKEGKASLKGFLTEIWDALSHMPAAMRELAVIQIFTWLGLYCMWMFYSVAIAHSVFGATDPHSALYDRGVIAGANGLTTYQLVSTGIALILPFFSHRLGKVTVYTVGLLMAALGLLLIPQVHDPNLLWLPMVGVGIGWATILSMPYAILVKHLPAARYGLYMGLFNIFIVLPEILTSVGLGWVMKHLLHNNHMAVITVGGLCMLIASALTLRLRPYARTTVQTIV